MIFCLTLSILVCPTSYILEKTLAPKEVTQMAKKHQSTQQTKQKVGGEREERLWDTPTPPITPTPADTPVQQPTQPVQQLAQPVQQPAQPDPKPKSNPEK